MGTLQLVMTSPHADAFARAASGFWRETFIRRGAVGLLQGSGLEEVGKELGFWAYRLDDAFPANVHSVLADKTQLTFDPNVGVSETLGARKNAMSLKKFQYKVVNACRHPRVCSDRYGGITVQTMFQWGLPKDVADTARPTLPAVAEEMVQAATTCLVEELGHVRKQVGSLDQQRWYEDISRFYVVANRYENDTAMAPTQTTAGSTPRTSSPR